MGNNATYEEIFWPQKVGGVSFFLQQYSYMDLIGAINGYKVYLGICTAHSKRGRMIYAFNQAGMSLCLADPL